MKPENFPEDYELVQVHINGENAEVLIRNKNSFRAFGGVLITLKRK